MRVEESMDSFVFVVPAPGEPSVEMHSICFWEYGFRVTEGQSCRLIVNVSCVHICLFILIRN